MTMYASRFTQKPMAAAAKYQRGLLSMSCRAWLSRMAGQSTTATPAMSHTKHAGARYINPSTAVRD